MFCLIHRRIASACPPVLAAHRNTTPAFLDHHSSWLHGSLHWPARSSAKSQCPCLGADCWCRLLFTVAVSSQRITISNRNRGEIKSVSLKSLENNGIQPFAPFEPFKYLTRVTHCAVQGHVYTTWCTLRCTQLVIIEQRRCWSILMPESSFCLVLVLNTASLPRSGSTIFSIQIKFRLIIMSPADYCSCQCTLSTVSTPNCSRCSCHKHPMLNLSPCLLSPCPQLSVIKVNSSCILRFFIRKCRQYVQFTNKQFILPKSGLMDNLWT